MGKTVVNAAFVAVVGLFLYVMLGLYGAVFNVQETDETFNCHVMGDMECGPSAPWHGFTNLFNNYAE